MASHYVDLRKGREEEIYLHTNAGDLADVQMVVSSRSMSLFFDFTLKEAKSFRASVDAAIKVEEDRKARLAAFVKRSKKKQNRRK